MSAQNTENIIVKYLLNEATLADLDFLSTWLEDPKNEKLFDEYVKLHFEITTVMVKPDVDSIKKNILKEMKRDKNLLYRIKAPRVFKYAAIAVIFLGIGYLFQQGYLKNDSEFIIPNDAITLQLENGNIEIINEDGTSQIVDKQGAVVGTQKGSQLIYSNAIEKETLVYNTLTVPYGKRFDIQLSDGTNVFLNAGTSLKYPVKFIKGEDRQVFLNGEAYFEVAKNKTLPFVVKARDVSILVTGTAFNVSSYEEEANTNTVLVEGSVRLYNEKGLFNKDSFLALTPGNLASWDKVERKMVVSQVDTSIYTSWKDGVLIFKHMKFSDIIIKLERYYNLKIINKNQMLNERVITARFENNTIEHVLKSLKDIYFIDYNILNNQIIIN